ncbi:MAG: acyl-CoA thioesterase [Sphingomonadales bacterium]|nr:acyl-CoA thioesterase [Sphingomonadales bacterium]
MRTFKNNFSAGDIVFPIPDQLVLDPIPATLPGDRFRNRINQANAYQALFGGQIVAQALAAADLTVDTGRTVHSLHAYFLRAGNAGHPVEFVVERVRDGRRFSTRRVAAMQNEKVILTLDASYSVPLPGFEHQRDAEFVFDPENALDRAALAETAPDILREKLVTFLGHYPVDIRFPSPVGFTRRAPVAKRHFWLRARDMAPSDDERLNRAVLAYLSDFMFSGAPLVPHTVALAGPHVGIASLDHSMWFHRPVRSHDWLLFETESPSARGSIGLTRGLVYDRAGNLVATVAQEALHSIDNDALGEFTG